MLYRNGAWKWKQMAEVGRSRGALTLPALSYCSLLRTRPSPVARPVATKEEGITNEEHKKVPIIKKF